MIEKREPRETPEAYRAMVVEQWQRLATATEAMAKAAAKIAAYEGAYDISKAYYASAQNGPVPEPAVGMTFEIGGTARVITEVRDMDLAYVSTSGVGSYNRGAWVDAFRRGDLCLLPPYVGDLVRSWLSHDTLVDVIARESHSVGISETMTPEKRVKAMALKLRDAMARQMAAEDDARAISASRAIERE